MKYEEWYKKHGMRRKSDIDQEPSDVREAKLPVDSAIHYLDIQGTNDQCVLSPDDILITAGKSRIVYVDTVEKLVSNVGNPKTHKAKINDVRKCVKSFDAYKPLLDDSLALISGIIPVLINYQGLSKVYEYKKSKRGNVVHRVNNLLSTVVDKCNEISRTSDRHNFIYIDYFDKEVPYDLIKKYAGYDYEALAKKVKNPDTYFSVELSRYSMNEESVFSELTPQAAANTTLMIRKGSYFIAIEMDLVSRKSKTSKVGFTLTDTEGFNFLNDITLGLVDKGDKVVKPVDKNDDKLSPEDDVATAEKLLDVETPVFNKKSETESLLEDLDEMAASKGLKPQQKYALKKKIESKDDVENPFTGKSVKSLTPASIELNPDKVKDNPFILDKSMLTSTVGAYTEAYVRDNIDNDKARMVFAIRNAGVIINNYTVVNKRTITGAYEQHSLTTTLLNGGQSTVKFKIPIIKEDGTFKSSGTEYVLKKQRIEAPISKIKPGEVLLSSYYGKMFVMRSDLSVHNFDKSLHSKLMDLSFRGDIKVKLNNVSEPHIELPRIYTLLSTKFRSITVKSVKLDMSYKDRGSLLSKGDTLKSVEKTGILTGKKGSKYITVDDSNTYYVDGSVVGDLFDLLDITYTTERGVTKTFRVEDRSVIIAKVLGKRVPVVFLLGRLIGLSALLKLMKVKATISSKRVKGYTIKFSDVYMTLSNLSEEAKLVFQGLRNNSSIVSLYTFKDFNDKDVYSVIAEELNLRAGTMEEIDFQNKSFIEPLTRDALTLMKEPTEYVLLILRSVELLKNDKIPDLNDAGSGVITDRIRGYERIPGAIYTELIKSIRTANRQLNVGRRKIAMSDYAVWQAITADPSVETVKAINPVAELKEHEAVVLTGTGGFSKQAIAEKERVYREKDLGVISESTPDSGDVGVTTFLAPGAQLTTLMGTSTSIKDAKDNPAASMSTSMLLSPGSDKDDSKRANMISVQAGHAVSIKGSELPYVRTGYDLVVANRTSDKFAVISKKPGKVKSINKDGIIVKYDDGDVKGYPLGERYLKQSGKTFPNMLVSDLKKGDKVKVGDSITYNKGFFIKDDNAKALSFQNRAIATLALAENKDTYEDGCSMSAEFAEKLSSDIAKERSFTVEGDKQLLEFPKVGQDVYPSDKLFVIHTTSTLDEATLTKESIEALKDIGSNAPSAKYKGKIVEIEVFYHGSRTEFSSSINRIIKERNAVLKERAIAVGDEPFTCEVDGEFKVNGVPLSYGSVHIRILIGSTDTLSTGDKIVTGAQAKATVSSIYNYPVTTEDGRNIDVFFSYRALMARLIPSAITTSMANSLLKAAPLHMQILMKK